MILSIYIRCYSWIRTNLSNNFTINIVIFALIGTNNNVHTALIIPNELFICYDITSNEKYILYL